jgi:hypothetical protein
MRSLGELIMVQAKAITTTSPYSPQNYFKSMHSQARDQKVMSETFSETFNAVSVDNLYTTQTPECTKDKYNVKIVKRKSLLRSHQQPT